MRHRSSPSDSIAPPEVLAPGGRHSWRSIARLASLVGLSLAACGPGPLIIGTLNDQDDATGDANSELDPPSESSVPESDDEDTDELAFDCERYLPDDYVEPADVNALDIDCSDGVAHGNISIDSASAMARLAECRVIVGNLKISGTDVEDVSALGRLECVAEDLTIVGTRVRTLDGLDALEAVQGEFRLKALPLLDDVFALSQSLRVVGSLVLSSLPLIESVSAFVNVQAVREVELATLDRVSTLNGLLAPRSPELVDHEFSVSVHSCRLLEDFEGFQSATRINTLRLSANPKLRTLLGLDNVTHIASLELAYRQELDDLAGLDALEELGRLLAEGPIDTFGPLPRLRRLDAVELQGGGSIPDFAALANIEVLPLLRLESAVYGSLASFPVPRIHELEIIRNLYLQVDDLPPIERAGRVSVILNPMLDQSAAEAWAAGIDVEGQVKIDGNRGVDVPLSVCPWLDDGECDEWTELCDQGTDPGDCE